MKELSEVILNLTVKDFFKLCVEHRVDCYLVAEALSICSCKLLIQFAMEKKQIGADDEIKQNDSAD